MLTIRIIIEISLFFFILNSIICFAKYLFAETEEIANGMRKKLLKSYIWIISFIIFGILNYKFTGGLIWGDYNFNLHLMKLSAAVLICFSISSFILMVVDTISIIFVKISQEEQIIGEE